MLRSRRAGRTPTCTIARAHPTPPFHPGRLLTPPELRRPAKLPLCWNEVRGKESQENNSYVNHHELQEVTALANTFRQQYPEAPPHPEPPFYPWALPGWDPARQERSAWAETWAVWAGQESTLLLAEGGPISLGDK